MLAGPPGEGLIRNHGLPERDASVVGRDLGVQENLEPFAAQAAYGSFQQVQILERSAAEADPANPL